MGGPNCNGGHNWLAKSPSLLAPVSFRFIFVFALSQFSGPDYLGAWNRLFSWRRPLCHKVNLPSSAAWRPLCHKVNLPWSEARRRHFIMTCDIFGTGQAKIFSSMLFIRKKLIKPSVAPLKSLKSTHSTKLLKTDIDVSTQIPLEALMIPLKCVRGIVLKHNPLCSSVPHQKCGLTGSLISTQAEKNCQWTVSFYSKFQ